MGQNTHYELTFILNSSLPENEYPKTMQKIKDLINKNNGNITFEQNLGRKKLSYPIKKSYRGNLFCLEFDIAPETLKPIEKELKLNKTLLRFITIKKPASIKQKKEKPIKEKKLKTKLKTEKIQIDEEIQHAEVIADQNHKKDKDIKERQASLDELDKKLYEILSDEIID